MSALFCHVMVHAFEFDGKYFVYDVESGSAFISDKLVYQLLKGKEAEGSHEEIGQAKREIGQLKEQGLLFADPPALEAIKPGGQVKALCLHVCHDCNLRCEYCFGEGGTFGGKRERMNAATACAAIDFLIEKSGDRKNLEVDFFGGEPLLNFEVVKDAVSYARMREKECGKLFKFTLTTNALLLSDETADFLNREMDNVVISLDGRKHVHDAMRKTAGLKGSYDIAMENARRFKRLRGDKSYYVRGTFTAKNLDFSKDVLHLADEGFDQISIEPVVTGDGELAIKRKHLSQIFSEYELLAKEYILRRRTGKWFNFFHFMVDLDGGPCLKKRLTGCGAGCEYLAIAPSGDIYPCHQFVGKRQYLMGDVFSKSVNEGIRQVFASSSLLSKEECKGCFAKYFCSGGCAANNSFYGGGIDKPYKLSCEMMRKRFECALAIYCLENAAST